MIRDYLRITDKPEEIRKTAKRLVEDVTINVDGVKKRFYTPLMLGKMKEEILRHLPQATPEEIEELRLKFIYDYWMYGCTVDEEFYLHLIGKSDAEKREYMVRQIRNVYVKHLNRDAGDDRVRQLEDKYRLYQRLKPFYKREVIEVREAADFGTFACFAESHKEFVVKPVDCSLGVGVHKVTMDDFGGDCRAAFDSIISEGKAIHDKYPSKATQMVLEELIVQDEALGKLHPFSINPVRATAVRDKNGEIVLYRPRIKVGANRSFIGSAAQNSFLMEIDPLSGEIITDGFQENGNVAAVHPDTGIVFKGYQIPRWPECAAFVKTLMAQLPGYGYIGWDLALTPDGWCVIEGNYSGEFGSQMIRGRGLKKEFEELIGWKYDKDFWWQDNDRFAHN
ncbi:MAG: hypothetical protein J5950_02015 [Clostridia bacterium]|nr:hypothetical protein [Clostridia bacterium]